MFNLKTFALPIVRHLITTGAGALATNGFISGDEVTTVVSSVAALITVAWSITEKVLAKK